MSEMKVNLEKILPVSIPLEVYEWLNKKAEKIKESHPGVRVGAGTIAKAILIKEYNLEMASKAIEKAGIKRVGITSSGEGGETASRPSDLGGSDE
ncbi:MAG: hypothetical protein ACP6IS_11150 [Candidatus Asgardarchaeia archaeon]